jgi:hypothetical protein
MSNHRTNNQYSTPQSAQSAAVSNSMMRNVMRNNSTTMMSGGAPPSAVSGNGGGLLMNQLESRMVQILDDADHHRCSEGNQRALLAEKLESLRHLTKELEQDDWKYVPKKAGTGLSLSSSKFRAPSSHPF